MHSVRAGETMKYVDREQFLRDGFAIVRGLFSPAEAEEIRAATIEEVERLADAGDAKVTQGPDQTRLSPRGDMLTYPALRRVLLDRRLIDVVTETLGGTPCYWGESGVNVGALSGGARAWHTDAYDTPVTQGHEYPLVRCGIYLQDTARHSDGLALVAGSHAKDLNARTLANRARTATRPWIGTPRTILVASQPGDLLIWDMRILHSGEVVRLKHAPALRLPLGVQGLVPRSLRAPAERRRVVMFPTFGLPGPDLDSYLAHQREVRWMHEIWEASTFPDAVVDEALEAGLQVIRPVPEFGRGD